MSELYPILRDLVVMARQYDIGINIDAEEADRPEISLDLLENSVLIRQLAGWERHRFCYRAYPEALPVVVDYLD